MCTRNIFCLAMHCVCHREALGCRDAALAIPYLAFFFDNLGMVHRFFKFSGKRTALFEALQLEENSRIHKLVENAFTRWLSHDNVTEAFIKVFVPLIKPLEALQFDDFGPFIKGRSEI